MAAIILSVSALVLALAVFVLIWRRGLASAQVDLRHLSATITAVEKTTSKINTAVNDVPEGEKTLVQRVRKMEQHQCWAVQALYQIASHVGANIDEPPGDPA